jgi:hypothetical protein
MQRNAEKNEIMRSGASFASPLRTSAPLRLCVSLFPFQTISMNPRKSAPSAKSAVYPNPASSAASRFTPSANCASS